MKAPLLIRGISFRPVNLNKIRWFLLALLSPFLASCQLFYFASTISDDLAVNPSAGQGVLLGSIGIAEQTFIPSHRSIYFAYRRKDSTETLGVRSYWGHVYYPPMIAAEIQPPRIDIEEGARRIAVFHYPLPPGEYEIHEVSGQLFYGRTFKDELPKSIPFSISKDRTTYLGEYILHVPQGKDYFVLVSDNLPRDMKAAEDAGRPVMKANVLKALPDPDAVASSHLRRKSP